MAADQIKIEIDVETRAAIAELAKVAGGVKDVEKETKKLTTAQKAWQLANTDLGKLTAGWRDVGEQVAKVGAVFAGLTAASVMAMAAQEKEEAAIRRLGAAYDAVSAATNGAMSAQQALTLQGQLQTAGVRINSQQLGLLARAAREYAQATGNDAAQAVEKLTNAIVNNSEDALSELNLAQARSTSSAQTLANMTRELEARFRGVSPAARTLNEDLEKLPQVMSYIGNAAAQAAAGGLRAFLDMLHGTGSAASYWRDIVNLPDDRRALARQGQSQDAMNRRQALRERIQRQAQGVGARFNSDLLQGMSERELQSVSSRLEVGTGVRGQSARGGDLNAVFGSIVAQNDLNLNMNGQFEGIVNAVRNEERMRQRREAAGEARPVDENVRVKESIAKSMNAAGDAAGNAATAFERAAKRIELSGTAVIDLVASAAEAAGGRGFRNRLQTAASALGLTSGTDAEQADLFGGIADSMEGGGSAARAERSRRSRIAARDRETRRQAREQSAGGRFGALFGIERDDSGNIKPLDGLQTGLSFAQQALPQLTSGFAELWTSIADGSATAGDAFAAFGAKALSTLGNVAIQEGSAMLLKAIPAMIEAPPLGAAYLAGGAGLIALGVGLGAAGAAARPQPTPSANSDANAARGMRSGSLTSGSKGGLGSTTVVMASLVPTGVVDAVNARNGLRQVRRSGLDDGTRAPRRIEY